MGVVGAVVSAIAAAASVGTSIYSMVSAPSPKQYQIPQEQLNAMNQQIAANAALDNQARAMQQQALNLYTQGQLSTAYQGQYDQQTQAQLEAIKNQLAAQGFDQNSSQYQKAMQDFQTWASGLKSNLLQSQLNAAMSAAGYDQQAIGDMQSSWQVQGGITAGNNQAIMQGTNQAVTSGSAIGSGIGNFGTAIANNPGGFEKLGQIFPGSKTATPDLNMPRPTLSLNETAKLPDISSFKWGNANG